jgi:hypothetical protein
MYVREREREVIMPEARVQPLGLNSKKLPCPAACCSCCGPEKRRNQEKTKSDCYDDARSML